MTTNYYYSTADKDSAPEGADFAVTIDGHELEPYISPGGTVYCSRTEPVCDGDVGIFLADGKMLCRQYCEDSMGNIHLFSVNRSLKRLDLHVENSGQVFCFGKVFMEKLPLPTE